MTVLFSYAVQYGYDYLLKIFGARKREPEHVLEAGTGWEKLDSEINDKAALK